MSLDAFILWAAAIGVAAHFSHQFHKLNHKADRNMSQLDDLTAAVAKVQADLTTLTNNVGIEVATLQAEIAALQASNPAIDLTGVINSVNAIDAAIQAATPAVPAPAPTPPSA